MLKRFEKTVIAVSSAKQNGRAVKFDLKQHLNKEIWLSILRNSLDIDGIAQANFLNIGKD